MCMLAVKLLFDAVRSYWNKPKTALLGTMIRYNSAQAEL